MFKHNKGFSLMEVMVALLLISLTMLMFGYFAKSLKITSDSRQETQAITNLRSSLDQLRGTWGTNNGYNQAELPYFIEAPAGFTKLKVDVTPLYAGTLSFSCNYTFNTALKKFENNCPTPDLDLVSLIRAVDFTLESDKKDPLVLSMQISRPVN